MTPATGTNTEGQTMDLETYVNRYHAKQERLRRKEARKWRRLSRHAPARRTSICPQCGRLIHIGSTITMPYEPNASGGNRFDGMWYCKACGEEAQKMAEKRKLSLDWGELVAS